MDKLLTHFKSVVCYAYNSPSKYDLLRSEYFVLLLVIGLLSKNKGIVSQIEVCKANKAIKHTTTYTLIRQLTEKGYLSKHRPSNQFYSRSYLSLTDKGLLLQAKILEALK